jgi:hypothetical protein
MVLLQCPRAPTNIFAKSVRPNSTRIPLYSLSSPYLKFRRCHVSPEPRCRLRWIHRSPPHCSRFQRQVLFSRFLSLDSPLDPPPFTARSTAIRCSIRRHSPLHPPPLLLLFTPAIVAAAVRYWFCRFRHSPEARHRHPHSRSIHSIPSSCSPSTTSKVPPPSL